MIRPIEPISKETAVEIHRRQIERHGGMDGVGDDGLLEAALAQPWQGFGGIELYPTIEEKAARLGYEIVCQHPFTDANKRTGAALMAALLRANDVEFKPRSDDLHDTIMGVAEGSLGYADMLDFVRRAVDGNEL